MKKNNKSFADRAKDLIKKYKRSDFDKNEKAELDAALQKLSEEQEQYKMANKIGEYSDEAMAQKAMQQQEMMAQQSQGQFPQGSPQGQPMQMDSQVGQMVGQGVQVPQEMRRFGDGDKDITRYDGMRDIGKDDAQLNGLYYGQLKTPSLYSATPTPDMNLINSNLQKASQPVTDQDQQIGMTQSILPSVISGGIGMLGNIALGAGVKEHKFNKSYGADQISLAKERERLSREATTARNIGMRNLRGAGSRGAYLAGAGNVSAGVNQQLSNSLSDSYFKEGMTNLQQREKADELNRQVALMNYQAKINADNERRGYYAAAAGIPAQTMQDINQINYQNSALLSSGTDNYLAGTNGKPSMWKNQPIYRKFKK